MIYDDFEVRISHGRSGGLSIHLDCEAGEDDVEMAQCLKPIEGRALFTAFRAATNRGGALPESDVSYRNASAIPVVATGGDIRDIGRRLFAQVLPPRLRPLWDRCRALSSARSNGLRMRLHLDFRRTELAWLGELPWELLYDDDAGGFLALDGRTPVVRYLEVRQDRRPFPRARPWRVLVVMPRPAGVPPLDLDGERRELLATWSNSGDVELVYPERPTFDGIHRELARREIHGIHFMGHGLFDERTGWGGLLLEGEIGQAAPLLGPAMGQLVNGVEPPALVVLNGCETGRSGTDAGPEPFGGAAAALMDAGVPAVVAMQLPIADPEAIHFSRILYRALQDGHPVDRAVSEARLSLSQAFPSQPAWAIPGLFMRVPDGRLFEQGKSGLNAERVQDSNEGLPRGCVSSTVRIGRMENSDVLNVGQQASAATGIGDSTTNVETVVDSTDGGKVEQFGVQIRSER